jgi:alcohol dehydrogenase class IV
METPWTYYNPTRVLFGEHWLTSLRQTVDSLGPVTHAVILTGRSAAKANGYVDEILAALHTIDVTVFAEIEPEPSHETIRRAAEVVADWKAQLVIGVGGGSVLDAAKIVAAIAGTGADVTAIADRVEAVPLRSIRLIVLPTTAGTGSEVTPFSVLTNRQRAAKQSIPSPNLYPDVAVMVPRWLATVPPQVAGDTGMDALAHALEALWSTNANPVSDTLAFRAIRLIRKWLPEYYENRGNSTAASGLAEGALLAGKAFSNTFTAACHALSYPIGKRFGLSHGAACAINLHAIDAANTRSVRDKMMVVAELFEVDTPEDVPTAIRKLRERIGTIPSLKELGASEADLRDIARDAFAPLMRNNPVPIDGDTLVRLLGPEL